jgi:hypothetical protein
MSSYWNQAYAKVIPDYSGIDQGAQFEQQAFFPIADGRYHITLKVETGDSSCFGTIDCTDISCELPPQCFRPTGILGDSGADMILLTKQTANDLGYNLDQIYDNFGVQGIVAQPTEFKEVSAWVQLGNMRPLYCPIGLSVQEDGLAENLMGVRGVLDSGRIAATYDNTGVTYRVITKASLAHI